VEVIAVDEARVHVRHLEAVAGTPILDLKPVLSANVSER
jgi:tRNA (Thr-GGU) A37 N-methylase